MFVYQDGKLYAQKDDKLIGVEIYSDNVLLVEGTDAELNPVHEILTPFEVKCKFGIFAGQDYIFPVVKESDEESESNEGEVETDEPAKPVKRTTRKSK